MTTYIKKQLNLKKDNVFKKLYKEIETFYETEEENINFIEELYKMYLTECDGNDSDDEFYEFAIENKDKYFEFIKAIDQLKEDIKKAPFITLHINLNGYHDIYRTVTMRSYYSVDYIAYVLLASFNLLEESDYILYYKGKKYCPNYMVYEEIEPNALDATVVGIADIGLSLGDVIEFNYNNLWNFTIKVANITEITEENLDLLDGNDIILEASSGFDLNFLDEKGLKERYDDYFDRVSLEELTQEDLDERMDIVLTSYDILDDMDFDDEEYDDEYDEDNFEEDFDEDEDSFDDEYLETLEEQREFERKLELVRKELSKLHHIRKYEAIKKVYMDVMDVMVSYMLDNKDKYDESLSSYFRKKSGGLPKQIAIEKIALDPTSQNNLFVSMVLPLGEGYEPVIKYFIDTNYFKKNKKDLVNALQNTKYGIYDIISYDSSQGIVILKNLATTEEIEVVDVRLSTSAEYNKNKMLLIGRILTFENMNILITGDFIYPDKEVFDFVDKMQEDYPDPITLEFFVAKTKERQMHERFNK